jgi:ureidoacrylate peracid hydrolase
MADTRRNMELAGRIAHVRVLDTLQTKIAPAHTALLIIDMQNDFCATDGMVAQAGRDVSPAQAIAGNIATLIEAARAAGALVIFVRNVYSSSANAYLSDVWLEQAARKQGGGYTEIPVCAAGTWGGDFWGNLRPAPDDPVVTKHRYSAFLNTDLDTILRANAIRTLVLTGVTTDVCVGTTAREAFMRDYYVVVVEDATAAYGAEDHVATLRNIDRFFGEVMPAAAIAGHWSGDQPATENP